MCGGAEAAATAADTARKTFEDGAAGDDLPPASTQGEISLIDALVALDFVASKTEARRMIPGAVRNPYVLASINRHREPVYAA